MTLPESWFEPAPTLVRANVHEEASMLECNHAGQKAGNDLGRKVDDRSSQRHDSIHDSWQKCRQAPLASFPGGFGTFFMEIRSRASIVQLKDPAMSAAPPSKRQQRRQVVRGCRTVASIRQPGMHQ